MIKRSSVAAAVLLSASWLAAPGSGGSEPQRVGGCQTSEREYGLPALSDSVAGGALRELLAPGMGPKAGALCRALGVDGTLFAQIGAVEPPADSMWADLGAQLTDRCRAHGLRIARRTLLRHTTGTCFPPFHVDFECVGDSASAGTFLADLLRVPWTGFAAVKQRSERRLWIAAGTSLQQLDTAIDLKPGR